jgi:hypothetical protein
LEIYKEKTTWEAYRTWDDNIKIDLKGARMRTEFIGSVSGLLAGPCEHSNETLGSIKVGDISGPAE